MDTLCDTSTIFQLTPSRRATGTSRKSILLYIFQLTPSRRATISHCCNPFLCLISTHALTEGDNSPPYRFRFTFISTHALTEGDAVFIFDRRTLFISTHALTEGDEGTNDIFFLLSISTHALTEGDKTDILEFFVCIISTHALTEGDWLSRSYCRRLQYFNSRPHGGRPRVTNGELYFETFQLTPSRRATQSRHECCVRWIFQLTPSRRATLVGKVLLVSLAISTHALTEGDLSEQRCLYCICHFNSRPHGGRHVLQILVEIRGVFQLTPSRRATAVFIFDRRTLLFQLTPSRRATGAHRPEAIHEANFNSRPHGGRLLPCSIPPFSEISTHALTEGDGDPVRAERLQDYFNSRPHGGRRFLFAPSAFQFYFNSRPHGGRPNS